MENELKTQDAVLQEMNGKLDKISEGVTLLLNTNRINGDMILDLAETSQYLHLCTRQLQRLESSGELQGFKVGKRKFYMLSKVKEYANRMAKAERRNV